MPNATPPYTMYQLRDDRDKAIEEAKYWQDILIAEMMKPVESVDEKAASAALTNFRLAMTNIRLNHS